MGALWSMESPTVRGGTAVPLAGVLGAGIAYLAVSAVGQLTWPRPSGPQRRARLTPCGIEDTAGAWAPRLIALPLAVAVVAVLLPALLAPLDGPSAGTRDVYRSGWDEPPSAVVTVREVLGLPWPGLRHGLPALLAMTVLVALALLALRAVADRATVTDAGTAWDRATRTRVARRITAGVLATVGGIVILTTGSRLMETETGLLVPGGRVLLVAGALWAAAGIVLTSVGGLWPARRRQGAAAAGSRA